MWIYFQVLKSILVFKAAFPRYFDIKNEKKVAILSFFSILLPPDQKMVISKNFIFSQTCSIDG